MPWVLRLKRALGGASAVAVRVEVRQAHHPQDLAGAGIEDQAGAAGGGEALDRMGELAAHRLLDAEVDGERERPRGRAGAAEPVLEAVLDPGETLVLDPDIADQVGGQLALRVDPMPFGAKADAGQAQAEHASAARPP